MTAWRAVTDAVHAEGGRIFAQLMHAGRVGHPVLYPDGGVPLGPSPLASGEKLFTPDGMLDHPVPREMTVDDIAQAVEEFAASARNAVEAGFDGVELHGANGYLIQQFLADGSNTRTDAYGGTIANRIRFGVEVARAVSEAIGPDRVGFRVSPGGTANGVSESDTAELYAALLAALAPLGLAYLHIMELGDRDMTRRLRAAWPGTLILNPHPTPESFPARPEYGAGRCGTGWPTRSRSPRCGSPTRTCPPVSGRRPTTRRTGRRSTAATTAATPTTRSSRDRCPAGTGRPRHRPRGAGAGASRRRRVRDPGGHRR